MNIDEKSVHIMPITPQITLVLGIDKDFTKKYEIEKVSEERVSEINHIIEDSAVEYVVL